MRIVFFGSDDFAETNLSRIVGAGHAVVACVTQPDRPKGRGMKVAASPIKTFAQTHGIPCLQPSSVREAQFLKDIRALNADLFVVIAYGQILPQELLDIPSICSVNVHASLLPKYRGAAPINWAVLNGEKETGVTLIRMNARMDAGDIIARRALKISDEDDAPSLRRKLADLGAECLLESLPKLEKKTARFTVQKDAGVTHAPKLTKPLGLIDWARPALEIHNKVRGLLSWPAAFTFHHGKMLKILASQVARGRDEKFPPGKVTQITKDGILMNTGLDRLLIRSVHPESGKVMSAYEYAQGHKIKEGEQFGN